MRETMHVENRMIRLGQFVEGEHTENRSERRSENGQLKGDGNKSRPAIEGTAADVQRVGARIAQYWKKNPPMPPARPPRRVNRGPRIRFRPRASERPCTGQGAKATN